MSEEPQKVKIVVLTLDGEGTLEVPIGFSSDKIDEMVKQMFGVQENGEPHEWRG